jgi:hypothetical protein
MLHQIKLVSAPNEPVYTLNRKRHDDISGTLSFFSSTASESRPYTVQLIQTYKLTAADFKKI